MKELELFPDDTISPTKDDPRERTVARDFTERGTRIRRSALWAAYGDALGWISELTDGAGLERRTGGAPLSEPITWDRRIGGRTGITARLPTGCYSDDSQLRLATSRAIRADGFDVEAFAKVELPVWLSYAFGGGKSTTVAAEQLAKNRSSWFVNAFKGWTESGGNGAAMRVQPHVWAARTPEDPASFLRDVVRNAICTHSHPTGIMGAVLHALCVARALVSGTCPSPSDLDTAVEVARLLPEIMASDAELEYWCSAFERESGRFGDAWAEEILHTRDAVRVVGRITTNATAGERYKNIVNGLRLRDPALRGSGTLTAVAATALTWCEMCPSEAMRIAANALGTDTDTIATMAGAILGAATEADPPVDVLDGDLFRSEAARLAEIAAGGRPSNHSYPDLLHWSAPMTRADALVCSQDGSLEVRGLGSVSKTIGEPIVAPNEHFQWQWVQLRFGQTLLIKRRRKLEENRTEGLAVDSHPRPSQQPSRVASSPEGSDLRAVLSYIEEHIDSDEQIGRTLRRVVSKGTPGEILEFAGKLIDLLRQTRPATSKRLNTRGAPATSPNSAPQKR